MDVSGHTDAPTSGRGTKRHRCGPKTKQKQRKAKGRLARPSVSPRFTHPIRVGSDCSGYGSEVLACEAISAMSGRLDFVFASEQDPHVRAILMHNCPHKKVYHDVTTRTSVSDTDIYVNTSPCTTFSSMGLQAGADDEAGMGCLMLHGALYINQHKPSCFVFENVKNLLQKNTSLSSWKY